MKTIENEEAEFIRNYVATTWTPQRALIVQNALALRVRRRRLQKVALVSVAMLMIFAGGGTWLLRSSSSPKARQYATAIAPVSTALDSPDNGVRIATLKGEDDLADVVAQINNDEYKLVGAGAKFDISVRRNRHFLVHVNSLTIDVLGAAFSVTNSGATRRGGGKLS